MRPSRRRTPTSRFRRSPTLPLLRPAYVRAQAGQWRSRDGVLRQLPQRGSLIESGQAADITPYVDEIKTFPDYNSSIDLFKKDGKIYGLPTDGYGMGLVYNKEVFTKAGLDPNTPPKTWAEVRAAAKKIAELGPGYVGYGEYSGNNVGAGTSPPPSTAGADRSSPPTARRPPSTPPRQGRAGEPPPDAVGRQQHGSQLYIDWPALMKAMAGGKMGMMLGAPDVLIALRNDFGGKFENYAITAQPEAKALFNGGAGYMINRRPPRSRSRPGSSGSSMSSSPPARDSSTMCGPRART